MQSGAPSGPRPGALTFFSLPSSSPHASQLASPLEPDSWRTARLRLHLRSECGSDVEDENGTRNICWNPTHLPMTRVTSSLTGKQSSPVSVVFTA